MNSKLELRLEAARIAAKLDDVTIENFPEAASRIEHYLLGDATLPEQDSAMPELMDMLKSARQRMEHAFDRSETGMGIGPCTGIGDTEALKVLERSKDVLGARYAQKGGPSVF
jgi:hypothetical protein